MSSHYSMLQSKILVSECYLLILLEWSDDVTGYCAHVLPGSVYKLWLQLLLLVCVRKLVLMPPPLNWSEKSPSSSLLCSGLFNCRQAASAFCCSSSVGGTVSPPQHVWSSGFRNCRPDDVELTANTPSSCGEWHRCIWTIVFWVLAYTAH